MTRSEVGLGRVYDVKGVAPGPGDPDRVLVDRLWPRGVKKEALYLANWMKSVAPSTELRVWYGHDPSRWEEFRKRYLAELEAPEREADIEQLARIAQRQGLLLLTATRDSAHSEAEVLRELVESRIKSLDKRAPA